MDYLPLALVILGAWFLVIFTSGGIGRTRRFRHRGTVVTYFGSEEDGVRLKKCLDEDEARLRGTEEG
jgi:hypothetical protein